MLNPRRRKQSGFTLVELLIVVIILGILAAVVIPQFTTASSEAKESALVSNLATIRQAIELYHVQHADIFPDGATFVTLMTNSTDSSGDTAGDQYGPYIRNSFPNNPINGLATVNDGIITANDSTGWMYDDVSGEFRANATGQGPSGTNYADL